MDPRARRREAEEFANQVVERLRPAPDDRPYVVACIRDAYLFEYPPQPLEIGLSPVGPVYNLTFKGFRQTFNLAQWTNLFFGKNKDAMLANVTGAHIQLTDHGLVCMLEMNKVAVLRRAGAGTGRVAAASAAGGGMAAVQQRTDALGFAKSIMADKTITTVVAQEDMPYVEAVIVEALMFEPHLGPHMQVSLKVEGHLYNLIFRGYKSFVNVVRWVNTFLGIHRQPTLSHVIATFVITLPLDEGGDVGIKIQMNKIEFQKQEAADDSAEAESHARVTFKRPAKPVRQGSH